MIYELCCKSFVYTLDVHSVVVITCSRETPLTHTHTRCLKDQTVKAINKMRPIAGANSLKISRIKQSIIVVRKTNYEEMRQTKLRDEFYKKKNHFARREFKEKDGKFLII
jgi:hypothetical protein